MGDGFEGRVYRDKARTVELERRVRGQPRSGATLSECGDVV